MINFIKYKRIYYGISSILILASLFSLVFFGVNFGIEFTGGSMMEIEYSEDVPSVSELRSTLSGIGLNDVTIQSIGENGFVLRMPNISQDKYILLKDSLSGATEKYFESIGPTIGEELKNKSVISIILASLAIVLYIALTFRNMGSKNIRSWQYGMVAAGIGFFHDVLIVLGAFSIMGYLYGIQFSVPIAVALLTVLGYSINDTVVVFDRIRENIAKNPRLVFPDIVNKSLNETLERSINTSATTLFVLIAIFVLGGETIRWFVFAMILGISVGTYSSIFLAGPLLVTWFNNKK
ncbi:MAG: preprotein translocase subunit SecF [Parcubacteria group bacterium ADurb.Bin247]|nr:MAG: preprotein translocase subunit SecF [Parcubacteria group bacterium ADurb.Bin247]HQB85123.1 protein translocase subunit SecF [Candidatus Pacearchaeota archaeon]